MVIKAICFDADGVVVNPQLQFAKHLDEKYNISPEMTRGFFRGIFNDCLVGKANLPDVLPPFLSDWGWESSVAEFIRTWLQTEHIVDERLMVSIQVLRQKGIVCCLATSQEHNRAEYMKAEMGFQDLFDQLFFSCEIGWQKPAPGFYAHIEKTLAIKKEKILFWDDSLKNVAAARARGWQAEQYTGFDAFKSKMEKIGL
ncbi:MAG: HAD-IA family hydrolase [Anaerolineales bacterium]|nr:HAD-IA family hydrolase [Anaerolineales bacterium]